MEQADKPETASVGLGHESRVHLGSLKPPIYETSTFVFETAEQGRRFFEVVYGLDEARDAEEIGYIYSRLDSPGLRPAEARIASWEEAEGALLFSSGMAAITSVFLTFLRPGDLLLHSSPVYGGTAHLISGLLAEYGIVVRAFGSDASPDDLDQLVGEDRLAMIYIETPSNPTNEIFDIAGAVAVAGDHDARVVVDNTFLSPVWQKPLTLGAHMSLHSATKYLGGHSDLTAGAVACGGGDLAALRHMRYAIGTTPSPSVAWLLARSLETLQLRVHKQTANATRIAAHLDGHDAVVGVSHLSLITEGERRHDIYRRQCLGPGAMISLEVRGGEPGAYRFLNALRLVHLTVSLGGTESLASHPWSMSHIRMAADEKLSLGVTPGLVRLSVGIEDVEDLIRDLDQALDEI